MRFFVQSPCASKAVGADAFDVEAVNEPVADEDGAAAIFSENVEGGYR